MTDDPAKKLLPCIAPEDRTADLEKALAPWNFRLLRIPGDCPRESLRQTIRSASPEAAAVLVDASAFEGTDGLLECLRTTVRDLPVLVVVEDPAREAAVLAALAATCPACPFDLCRRDLLAEQAGPRLAILEARAAARASRLLDGLTGLGNRTALREALDRELAASSGPIMGFFILDIDNFKSVNDSHGHAAGDEALRRAANLLLSTPEAAERSFRIGGDEFAGIVTGRSKAEVARVLDDLVEAFPALTIQSGDAAIRITVSLGFTFLEPGMSTEDAYTRADVALYSAKAAGKNRARCHDLCWDSAREDPGQAAVEHFENVTRVWTDRMSELIRSVGRKAMEEARRGANTDGLTGLSNRAYYDRRIARDLETALRTGAPLSLILFDVDDFHGVNMEYGYPSGDRALAKVAELVRNHARVTDWSARYGGEEFVIVLPGADGAAAGLVAERFRQALEAAEVRALDGRPIPLTATVGVADLSEARAAAPGAEDSDVRPEDLVQKASDRVIEGKRSGKNRVVGPAGVTAGEPPAPRAKGRGGSRARLDILVVDDKEHAKLQVERALKNLGAPPAGITWVETLEDLEKLEGSRFDLAFVDFFLSKDRTYGVDAVPKIKAGTIVGYSSNAAASELIAETARKLGCPIAAALEKDKRKVESPALESFLGSFLRSRER
ncbi:MAG: GGDEF domain-containing protein [Treponema sp.]|nr:GGDEF domain-containing protein [Treponema sp.]